MRFLLAPPFYEEMKARSDHTPDCYVRPGEYLHHLYLDGVKYVVAQAMLDCLETAKAQSDGDAVRHLELHKMQFEAVGGTECLSRALSDSSVDRLGDPPPDFDGDEQAMPIGSGYAPQSPRLVSET